MEVDKIFLIFIKQKIVFKCKKKKNCQQFRTNALVRESFCLLCCGSGRVRVHSSELMHHQLSTKWIQGHFTNKCKGWLAGSGHNQGSYGGWDSPSFMGGGGRIKTTRKRAQNNCKTLPCFSPILLIAMNLCFFEMFIVNLGYQKFLLFSQSFWAQTMFPASPRSLSLPKNWLVRLQKNWVTVLHGI